MSMFSSLGSMALAFAIAGAIGPPLGRIATQWFSGRGLINFLTELRGAFLPFLLVPWLLRATAWPIWICIGIAVGVSQAVAIARWGARRTGQWSPQVIGALALGQSGAAMISARTLGRGAVVATLGALAVQVVLVEFVLSCVSPQLAPAPGAIGRLVLSSGSNATRLLVIALGALFMPACELAIGAVLRRGLHSEKPGLYSRP